MDKKLIIGAIVGALILFIWQFLSWAMLNIHGPNQQYTPNQTKILQHLTENLSEGEYFLPTYAPGATSEEMTAAGEAAMGKPWAKIQYHDAFEMNMGMNLTRGFVADLVALFILCWILLKIDHLDIKTAVMVCVGMGIINYLADDYNYSIWFNNNTIPDLIDYIVQWSLVGAWLGFYLNKK